MTLSRLNASSAAAVFLGGLISAAAAADAPPSVRADTVQSDYDAIAPYIGLWRSDVKTAADSKRTYYFEYELAYFDPGRQIVEMKIDQIFKDGERRLLWHGYKGWNRIEKETYYYGFSPQGRVSRGKFAVSDASFVTFYTGHGPTGGQVEVRDVFSSVSEGEFTNETWLRPSGERDWRVVAQDTWRRVVKN